MSLMHTTCPVCGTPTGHFPDPRIEIPDVKLGIYFCAVCRFAGPLEYILNKADAEELERILDADS